MSNLLLVINIFISLINLLILAFSIYFTRRTNFKIHGVYLRTQKELVKVIETLKKRIDSIFAVPLQDNTENEATAKAKDELQPFTETLPLDLPKDLKIEIEGGDTQIPPDWL